MLNRNLFFCAFAIIFLAACGDSKSSKESSVASKEIVSSQPIAPEGSLKLFSKRDIDIDTSIFFVSGKIKFLTPEYIYIDSVDNSRSKEEILEIVNARLPDIMDIYKKHLELEPGFSGVVKLIFTIAPSGDITKMNIRYQSTREYEFNDAIKNKVATWKWEPIKSGNTTVIVPFLFPSSFWDNFIEIDSGGYRSKEEIIQELVNVYTNLNRMYKRRYLKLKPIHFLYDDRAELLELNPSLNGRITLKFTIAPSGDIIEDAILSSTTGNPEFDNKAVRVLRLAQWEVIDGGNTTVTIPFDFPVL